MEFTHLIEPALTASVDLIALVVYGDPSKDAHWRAFDSALGGALTAAAKAENFEGKPSQVLTMWSKGPLKAQRVLALLDEAQGPIFVHGAVERFLPAYAAEGVRLPATTRSRPSTG